MGGRQAGIANIDRDRTPAKELVRRVKNRIIIGSAQKKAQRGKGAPSSRARIKQTSGSQ